MGRVWESKLELGSHPFLGKWVFDFLGKKMLGKACPSHCSSISLALSPIGELLFVSLHGFGWFLHFSHGWKFVFGLAECMCSWEVIFGVIECMCSWRKPILVLLSEYVIEIYVLGVWEGVFPFPHAAGNCWAFPSQIYVFSSLLFKLETCFL